MKGEGGCGMADMGKVKVTAKCALAWRMKTVGRRRVEGARDEI